MKSRKNVSWCRAWAVSGVLATAMAAILTGCGGGGGNDGTNGAAPIAQSPIATSIGTNGATLSGGVIPNALPTMVWFEYDTDASLTNHAHTTEKSIGSGLDLVQASSRLDGLAGSTTYYFRMCASNAKGEVASPVTSFTTSSPGAAPAVSTLAATSIGADNAIVNGNVTANGLQTAAWFEWGTDPAFASFSNTASQSFGSGTASQALSTALSGLSTGVVYYYRIAASNSSGTTRGSILSFTPGAAPTVATLAATSVGATTATLNGSVTANGLPATAWFEWGVDPSMTICNNTTTQSLGAAVTEHVLSIPLTGLSTGTTYYYRVAASNGSGTSRGTTASITPGTAPMVTTLPAVSTEGTTATLYGNVIPNGLPTNAWFEWGSDPALTAFSSTPIQAVGSDTVAQPMNFILSGLTKGATYFFRVAANNSSGTTRGPIVGFLAHLQGEFGNPFLLEHDDRGGALAPRIAMSPDGDAISVWAQSDGTRDDIWANRFSASADAWSGPVLLEVNDLGTAESPQIAMDENGSAIAVWTQETYRKMTFANRFSATSQAWSGAVEIDNAAAWASIHPQVAMSADGNAIAVFEQSDGTRFSVLASRYSAAANSWLFPFRLESNDISDASWPFIAMSGNGDGIAVWQQDNIVVNRYSAATNSWAEAVPFPSGSPNNTERIAMSPDGNGIVVWAQFGTEQYRIRAKRYLPTTQTWSGEFLLDDSDGEWEVWEPEIAIAANGDAIAVWRRCVWVGGGTQNTVWANRYSASSQIWSGAILLGAPVAGNDQFPSAGFPQVAMSAEGDGIVVWQQSDGEARKIWANRYSTSTQTWSGPFALSNDDGSAAMPRVAMSADGNAIAVWLQFDGTRYNVWANRTY